VRWQKEADRHIRSALDFQGARHFSGTNDHADAALRCLISAAHGWRSADDVSGLPGCPLKVAACGLRTLRRGDGVVQLCLTAARNFPDEKAAPDASIAFVAARGSSGGGGAAVSGVAGDELLGGLMWEAPALNAVEVRRRCFALAVEEMKAVLNSASPYPSSGQGKGGGLTLEQRQELASRCIVRALEMTSDGTAGVGHEDLHYLLYGARTPRRKQKTFRRKQKAESRKRKTPEVLLICAPPLFCASPRPLHAGTTCSLRRATAAGSCGSKAPPLKSGCSR